MPIKAYFDLDVWQKAMDLVVAAYKATASFPREEIFGLTSQIRRAAVSVPSNIAEGHSRNSTAEFLRHISIAQGSLSEVETQLRIGERLGYLEEAQRDTLMRLADEVGKMLKGLRVSLSSRQRRQE